MPLPLPLILPLPLPLLFPIPLPLPPALAPVVSYTLALAIVAPYTLAPAYENTRPTSRHLFQCLAVIVWSFCKNYLDKIVIQGFFQILV